jgi:hypothetical protein
MTMHGFVSNEDERALGLSVSLRLFNLHILQRRAIVLHESAVVNTGVGRRRGIQSASVWIDSSPGQ